jgi:hypothetical protein
MALALAAGAIALGCWWSSLLTIKAAGTLSAFEQGTVAHQIATQLDQIAPHTSSLPNVNNAITSALNNPVVTQSLARSVPGGSATLASELGKLDGSLAPLLKTNHLNIDIGQHALASLAAHLRSIARAAQIAAIVAAVVALVVSPVRHLILRHLAFGAGMVGLLALLIVWGLPAIIDHTTHGSARNFATTILSGGKPVRSVLLELGIGGALVYVATHVFELVGGTRKFRTSASAVPLPQSRIV